MAANKLQSPSNKTSMTIRSWVQWAIIFTMSTVGVDSHTQNQLDASDTAPIARQHWCQSCSDSCNHSLPGLILTGEQQPGSTAVDLIFFAAVTWVTKQSHSLLVSHGQKIYSTFVRGYGPSTQRIIRGYYCILFLCSVSFQLLSDENRAECLSITASHQFWNGKFARLHVLRRYLTILDWSRFSILLASCLFFATKLDSRFLLSLQLCTSSPRLMTAEIH